jgi:hypothetical protein
MIKPNRKVRFWCWTEVIGSAVLAWSGGTLAYLAQRDAPPASVALLTPVLIIAVGFSLFAWWKCLRAVLVDSSLTEIERKRIRSWLCNFGPAGVIQLLLFIHFPCSGLIVSRSRSFLFAAELDIVRRHSHVKQLGLLVASGIALACARAPSAPGRPHGIPVDAVLVPGRGVHAPPSAWVSCTPPVGHVTRLYSCSVYPHEGGVALQAGVFTLELSPTPVQGAAPVPTPSSLHLRSYDGLVMHLQEPWALVPWRPEPPVRADPPLPAVATPAPIPRGA